jgi:hypothetical protein
VNLLRDLVDLQMFRDRVEQDQVRLKMKGGMERAPAVVFLPDQISSGGLQRRSDNRCEMRLVIDQEYAFGKGHRSG